MEAVCIVGQGGLVTENSAKYHHGGDTSVIVMPINIHMIAYGGNSSTYDFPKENAGSNNLGFPLGGGGRAGHTGSWYLAKGEDGCIIYYESLS
jgi:hypothetical protein